ncbi:uncharacterized protein V1516DRAFT_683806 [Lipomyces oligophaga]|uniref:uncharacterized protein n=1 Tax=Lipomyces oligophaga TaxID=45792 RepID=UPI0034CEF57D
MPIRDVRRRLLRGLISSTSIPEPLPVELDSSTSTSPLQSTSTSAGSSATSLFETSANELEISCVESSTSDSTVDRQTELCGSLETRSMTWEELDSDLDMSTSNRTSRRRVYPREASAVTTPVSNQKASDDELQSTAAGGSPGRAAAAAAAASAMNSHQHAHHHRHHHLHHHHHQLNPSTQSASSRISSKIKPEDAKASKITTTSSTVAPKLASLLDYRSDILVRDPITHDPELVFLQTSEPLPESIQERESVEYRVRRHFRNSYCDPIRQSTDEQLQRLVGRDLKRAVRTLDDDDWIFESGADTFPE